mgnify:CR=1 FL=1
MFNKNSKKRLRKTVEGIEKSKSRSSRKSYSEDEVQKIVEAHTILGCRFGMFLLHQIINQRSLKDQIRKMGVEKVGMREEDLNDDLSIMKMLSEPENAEKIGESLHSMLMDAFISDEHTSHAQAILIEHASKDVDELMCAVKTFSEQLDDHYQENYQNTPSGLSPTIN